MLPWSSAGTRQFEHKTVHCSLPQPSTFATIARYGASLREIARTYLLIPGMLWIPCAESPETEPEIQTRFVGYWPCSTNRDDCSVRLWPSAAGASFNAVCRRYNGLLPSSGRFNTALAKHPGLC